MTIEVRAIERGDAAGFRECLDVVARERRYLAMVEALPLARVEAFVADNVDQGAAQFVAVDAGRIVGWCDILAHWAHALQHSGDLGIGVLPSHRSRGLGERLLRATLARAAANGITRVSLTARADNERAIRLYARVGFVHEARLRRALRFDGQYFDAVQMVRLQGHD